MELEIEDTADAVKGNTVSNATKKAKANTGLELDVPQFIQIGDKIIDKIQKNMRKRNE